MKYIKRLLCLSVITLCAVMFSFGVFSKDAKARQINKGANTSIISNADDPLIPGFVTGPTKMILGRAFQELVSLGLKSGEPGLTKFLVALQTPATRAQLQQQATIQKMAVTVEEIKQSVHRIENQLAEIDNKLDKYHAAEQLNSSLQYLNSISVKYKPAWVAYENVLAKSEVLAKLQEQKATLTDAKEIESIDEKIKLANNDIDSALNLFISIMNEGGGFQFTADITAFLDAMYNESNPSSGYLGAFTLLLREEYLFEHQITEELYAGYTSCADTLLQMLILYSEYSLYMKGLDENDINFKGYDESYFDELRLDILEKLITITNKSGMASYMIPNAMSKEEVDEILKEDPTFVEPENIHTTTSINNITYDAYKVRDNKDLQYYLILTEYVEKDNLVMKDDPKYLTALYVQEGSVYQDMILYRPTFMLDHNFTDDRKYKMVSTSELPSFIKDAPSVLSYVRASGELENIPQDATHFMFYEDTYHNNDNLWDEYFTWNLKTLPHNSVGNANLTTVTSKELYDSGIATKSIFIYKDVITNEQYVNGKWVVKDKGEIENKVISISDGQRLDLTKLTVDVSNVIINVVGDGSIISNPNITLRNSLISVATDGFLVIENLNIVGRKDEVAAIIVQDEIVALTFVGVNKVSGTPSEVSTLDAVLLDKKDSPFAVSCGIYLKDIATIHIEGTLEVYATNGGAGICSDTLLSIRGDRDNAKLIARGSSLTNIDKFLVQNGAPVAIGAGIGICISSVKDYSGGINADRNAFLNFDMRYQSLGSTGTVNISNLNVFAEAGEDGVKWHVDDIGGFYHKDDTYNIVGGTITDSFIDAKNARISDNISTKSDTNRFANEVYKVKIYTQGTNGVTSGGLYFNIYNKDNSSDWIYISGAGDEREYEEFEVIAPSVLHPTSVGVKTHDDNVWWGGIVEFTSKYSNSSITVYGGRAINTDEVILSPDDNVYCITIYTSGDQFAGTDSNIYLELRDTLGNITDKVNLSDLHYNKNAFETATKSDFYIYAPSTFDVLENIVLTSDHKHANAGWLVSAILASKVQGKEEPSLTIETKVWFNSACTISFGRTSGNTGVFILDVKTQNSRNAGTDSDIYINIIGEEGETGWLKFSEFTDDGNRFERDDLDSFRVGYSGSGIGRIKSIKLKLNDLGFGPTWKVDYINIKEELPSGYEAQDVRFEIDASLSEKNKEVEYFPTSHILKSSTGINREILKALVKNDDGSYTITVDKAITIRKEIFDYIKDEEITLNVQMMNNDKPLYVVTFDGTALNNYNDLTLEKSYGFKDGNALISFVNNIKMEGARLTIYVDSLGFVSAKDINLYQKDASGNWVKVTDFAQNDNKVEISTNNFTDLRISKKGLLNINLNSQLLQGALIGVILTIVVLACAFGVFVIVYKKKRKVEK